MMKALAIIGLVAGLMLIAGFVFVTAGSTEDVVTEEPETISCSSCGGSCNQQSNCGLSSCGAVTGGSCGCRG
jgi:hypothetical protein